MSYTYFHVILVILLLSFLEIISLMNFHIILMIIQLSLLEMIIIVKTMNRFLNEFRRF